MAMAEVNESLTRKVADLARLELTDAEVKTFTGQLGDILRYVDKLNQAQTDGIEPLTQPFASDSFLRPDVVVAAPFMGEAAGEGFQVPPIL